MKNNEIEIREEKGWLGPVAIIWVAYAITCFVAIATVFSMGWHVTSTTGDPLAIAAVTVCGLLPQGLLAPFGGVVADRINRKKILLTCYAVIVIAALITAGVIVAGHLNLPVILAFSLVLGVCCAGFAGPATTLLQKNCDPEYLGRVMGIFNSALALGMPIGTAVGGAIAAMTGVQLFFLADGAFMLVVGVFAAFSPSLRSLDGQAEPTAEAKMATTSAQG